jgi:hypothetical protein
MKITVQASFSSKRPRMSARVRIYPADATRVRANMVRPHGHMASVRTQSAVRTDRLRADADAKKKKKFKFLFYFW